MSKSGATGWSWVFGAWLLALTAMPASADDAAAGVFEDAPAMLVDRDGDLFLMKRSRLALIDLPALFGERAERGAIVQEHLVFNLFGDLRFEAVRRAKDLALGETPVWYGDLTDEPGGYALIVMRGDAFWGHLFSPSRGMFEIAQAGPGLAAIREPDAFRLPGCGTDHRHIDRNIPGHIIPEGDRERAEAEAQRGAESGTIIFVDVGFLYTAATSSSLGGTAATEAFLLNAVAQSNVAYENSLINLRIRAAFMAETSYTQDGGDMGLDLARLRSTSDGVMDEVHGLRNLHGADMIALIVNASTNACGIAYLMTSVGPAFESSAFSVTARTCISGLTLPHELGHNMGCAHDRDNAGGASWPYAYGYRTTGNQYRTVMAYAPGTRVPIFSNPNVTYQGFAMGVPIGQTNPCYNALAINNNASTIAAWRTLYTLPPGEFSLMEPSDGATTSDRTPDFSWEAAEQTDYYRLEVDDDPGFGSPEILVEPLTSNSYTPSGTPPLALDPGSVYHWRVTAFNPLGSQASSPVSRTFTTPALAPGMFSLTSPADGAVNVSRNPSFTWTLSNDADGYTLVVDDDPGFSSPEINVSGILFPSYSWSGTALPPSTTFYWKVSSSNSIGTTNATPSVRSFTTVGAPPGSFGLLTPPDGAVIQTVTPNLTWGAALFVDSYHLIVDNDQNLLSPIISLPGLNQLSYQVPPGMLVNGTRYYWQVRASNLGGVTNSSPAVATFVVYFQNCLGDSNGDGVINFQDISTTLSNWGGTGPLGDADNSGSVNFVDISTILSRWGQGC